MKHYHYYIHRIAVVLFLIVFNSAYANDLLVPAQYTSIQQAIDASVAGDTVIVSPGEYIENINFNSKAITVISEQGPELTEINGNQQGSVVTFDSGETNASVLSGFTITNGMPISSFGVGGGIRLSGSSPIIENNIIINNSATSGTAMHLINSSPIVRDNLITKNVDCCIAGGNGGTIYIADSSNAQILRNKITENILTEVGGAGGITVYNSSPIIKNNLIANNSTSRRGGAISVLSSANIEIIQNIITGNSAAILGGGIHYFVSISQPGPRIVNNTIVNNTAPVGPELAVIPNSSNGQNLLIINNIISSSNPAALIHCEGASNPTAPDFRNNNIFNSMGGTYGGICTDQTGVLGNISVDPLFSDPANNKYHLLNGSGSIDAGDALAVVLPSTDYIGGTRIVDGDNDTVALVDQGAIEFSQNGAIEFESMNIAVDEDTTVINVNVCRYGGTSGMVSADLSAQNLSATSGINYNFDNATVQFSDGEAGCKAVPLSIIGNETLNGDITLLLIIDDTTGGAILPYQNEVKIDIVDDEVDLLLEVSANPPSAIVNESVTFDFLVSNAGQTNAQDVVFSFSLPSNLSLISISPGQGVCNGSVTIVCNLGSIFNGSSVPIQIVVDTITGGIATGLASVSSDGIVNNSNDINPLNNSVNASIAVKDVSPAVELYPLNLGKTWTYLRSNGAQISTEAVINDSVIINGVNTVQIVDQDNFSTFYSNEGEGLFQHKQQDAVGDSITFIPPLKILNALPSVGDNLNSSGIARVTIDGSTIIYNYSLSSVVQDFRETTVPYGTFAAVTVDYFITISNNAGGLIIQSESMRLSKEIGPLIKNGDGFKELISVNPNPFSIASAVLPVSRSGVLGQSVTAFATIVNASTLNAQGCSITTDTSIPADFSFQTADALNNLMGAPNTSVDIPIGGVQNFVISFTPTAAFPPTDVFLNYTCSNTHVASSSIGLNTLLLAASTTQEPDIIGLTTEVDLQSMVGGTSLFAVGSSNIGASGDITVRLDDGGQNLPVVLNVCQTDLTGACSSPIGPTVTLNYVENTTASFAIFVQPTGEISNNPSSNRIFIRFLDNGGVIRGATSSAIRTQ